MNAKIVTVIVQVDYRARDSVIARVARCHLMHHHDCTIVDDRIYRMYSDGRVPSSETQYHNALLS
jgi:hypothetical protein